MKKTISIIIFLAALLLLSAGCVGEQSLTPPPTTAVPSSPHMFDDSNNQETYQVPIAAEVGLSLVENPTTGYQWNLTVPEGISVISDAFEAPTSGLSGAPGTHIWTMKAETAGTYTIGAKYVRSWETDAEPAETFSLTLVVGSGDQVFLSLNESDDGEIKTIPVNTGIRVTLVENPTTGYQWSLTVPEGISVLSDEFDASGSGLMGAPGTHIWTMKADVPGTYMIEGKYVRSWEIDAEPAETFTLILIVS